MRGKFLTLEGLDGAGKSTQLTWIEAFLRNHGVVSCVTREPGGTQLGEALRTLLLTPQQVLHPETETLLMFAARREHVDKVIEPALARGTWVLCDRFTDASFAYQGGGSGVEWMKIGALEAWVHGWLQPDVTLYFDIAPERAKSRAGAVRAPDRYEKERSEFHERARAAYLRRADEQPQRIRVVDANGSVTEIQVALEKILGPLCGAAR